MVTYAKWEKWPCDLLLIMTAPGAIAATNWYTMATDWYTITMRSLLQQESTKVFHLNFMYSKSYYLMRIHQNFLCPYLYM